MFMETITEPFLLKFGCLTNCMETYVFMETCWYGKDNAKKSVLKNMDFFGIEDFCRTPELYPI